MKKNKKGISKGKMLAVGAGVAAIGAGAYYFLGPKGKAHQKKAKALMAKIEREARSKVKQVKGVAKPIYDKAVDMLALKYSQQYKMHEKEIKNLAKKLKSEWKSEVKKAVKNVRMTAKKTVKSAARKTVRKAKKTKKRA